MRILVGGVTDSMQYVRAITSFHSELIIRPGDEKVISSGMRGDVARSSICDTFLARKEFDALLMLDLDMIHPPHLLEQLRAHNLDMVTAHYFRRKTDPMVSVVSISPDGEWPYYPMTDIPRSGLHEIVCAGFGCVLIKRQVVEAVQASLPRGSPPFALGPMPEMSSGDHGSWGSDYLFFSRAKKLGYKLWLDAGIESKHYCHVLLSRDLYDLLRPYQDLDWYNSIWAAFEHSQRRHHGMNKRWFEFRGKQLEAGLAASQQAVAALKEQLVTAEEQLNLVRGQVVENAQVIENWTDPPMEVPVYGSHEEAEAALARRGEPPEGSTVDDVKDARRKVFEREAKESIEHIAKYNEPPPED